MSSGYEEQELTAIGAALDANPDATSSEVFQATRPFDERAIASVAASRALAGGGGSSTPVNWCNFVLSPASDLTVASPLYSFQTADFINFSQSGTDFSIADGTGNGAGAGAVYSAGGGRFQCGVFIPAVADGAGATLDGSSTRQRFLWAGAQPWPSDPDSPSVRLSDLGFDGVTPILATSGFAPVTALGTIAYTPPGEVVYFGFAERLNNGVGTDVVSHASAGLEVIIWQIG